MDLFQKLINTNNSNTTIIIRLMVGAVFLSEGIQKFLFPEPRGAGRFEKIGLPSPDFLGTFVGSVEIVCGALILIGLLVRLGSLFTLLIMLVAIATTKSEVFANEGFWAMMHGSRTDWAMLLGSLFLMIKGGGSFSLDRVISKRINERSKP